MCSALVIAHLVQVAMANAAVENLDLDIVWPWLAPSISRGSSGALAARAPYAGIFIDMDKGETVVDIDAG